MHEQQTKLHMTAENRYRDLSKTLHREKAIFYGGNEI